MAISTAVGSSILEDVAEPHAVQPSEFQDAAPSAQTIIDTPTGWPAPLRGEAYYGLAGEFVHMVLPHTEADPVALLSQFLTAFGNVIGRGPHFMVERTSHHMNLFTCLVGETSRARKGTSLDHVEDRFRHAEPNWIADCQTSGLGSGEAVIWQVRDANGTELGVSDKRLLVSESEFGSILRVMGRKESILSNIMRSAWDGKPLRNTTKNSPATATNAHISVIGHITQDELRSLLTESEALNGFGNRFLWLCIRRSKLLPSGGRLGEVDFSDIDRRLSAAIDFAIAARDLRRTEEAERVWVEVYGPLTDGGPGLFGALTSRAEAQVLRLSCIYALLDQSRIIEPQHLFAALAVWDYAEASVQCIFGNATGNRDADRILSALRCVLPGGLTQTEISGLFQRNIPAVRLRAALGLLERNRVITQENMNTRGRQAVIWKAVTK